MLPRRHPRRQASAPLTTCVVFTAAGRRLALPTHRVVAVAEVAGLIPLPAPGRPEVLGVFAHRGRALPLIDLGRCLGRPDGEDPRGRPCVVVEHGERRAAFPVAELDGLARVAGPGLPPGCETFDPAEVVLGAGGGGSP